MNVEDKSQKRSLSGVFFNASEKVGFEVTPAPIPEEDILERVTADVVVIGAGVSGMMAALSASNTGAKTIVIEKHTNFTFRGSHNAAIGSKLQKSMGIVLDKGQVVNDLVRTCQNAVDAKLLWLWANNSAETMDYLLNMAADEGIEVTMYGKPSNANGYREYDTAHVFGQRKLVAMMEKNAKKQGVSFHYKMPAVQLIRKDNGRVTGVIAGEPGNYIQFNATKGVVLCTGDYGNNEEMIKKYCPSALQVDRNVYPTKTNTGDGHKMGIWVGAAMQRDEQHVAMVHNSHSSGPLAGNPWLRVNKFAERYENEDVPIVSYSIQIQPERKAWAIFDNKYPKDVNKFENGFNRVTNFTDVVQQQMEDALQSGIIIRANTIEELAQKIDVPVETFKATVSRYNELSKNEHDDDFGKNPRNLTTIEEAPYYALRYFLNLLVTLGGFDVNLKMQVLDMEGEVIPGLYAAGNTVGNRFHGRYPIHAPGLSHGLAETFGRIAGKNAAT